jgi:hypothetical protein
MEQYAPADPHYEETVDERTGKKRKVQVGDKQDHWSLVGGLQGW